MDLSAASLLACSLAYGWTSPGSDSDLSGLSSPETLSPLGYRDPGFSPASSSSSFSSDPQQPSCFSALDPDHHLTTGTTTGPGSPSSGSAGPRSPSSAVGRPRRVGRRGSIRSKQRESASEKEKMRMRDLTKALHYLRSFLPASVAPAGQTLTKIETLRLAISYIGHLSAQLGHGQQVLSPGGEESSSSSSSSSSPDTLGYLRSLYSEQWTYQGQGLQPPGQAAAMHPGSCSYGVDLHRYDGGQHYGAALQGGVVGTNMEIGLMSPPATHHAHCQMFGPVVTREYWG
ncbi:hypothetical protein NHX12_006519 [Muraenolepis orangiensis]|uniref:BHLH domain-containing protein n=1 Tax=Muraenolepis orangiensis TaxID=630683 RepID=A0A9Q0DTN2_9TELE|nr:hypothetical protein NHX12_006519 [Muraenolepis orangiensis]